MSADDYVFRRFGPGFEKPCGDPRTIECALLDCQARNRCKWLGKPTPPAKGMWVVREEVQP